VRHLDLFSGIGGFALAARWVGWETIGFCENDKYCQQVLKKHWPDVPIFDDVRELKGESIGSVDIITGGYPCQPFSLAGKRRGKEDDRHLWPEFARLIRELRPRWVLGENVAGHITMGLDEVLADLEGLGYTWEAFVIPACAVDAQHRRDRVWIVADSRRIDERPEKGGSSRIAVNSKAQSIGSTSRHRFTNCGRWSVEPNVGRVAHGIPRRVDRLRGLGNAIVPQVAEMIFRSIDAN